jgi:tRNA U34 5-methylaminomethyl-2-thiouridine-forming methyltransferase MnmC
LYNQFAETPKIITSEDGSHTIYLPSLNETYHSTHGAIRESEHIYINNGLATLALSEVNILEIGFGTGLNALLTYQYLQSHNGLTVQYDTLEAYPLSKEIYEQLNYAEFIGYADFLMTLHSQVGNQKLVVSNQFEFIKFIIPVELFQTNQKYDIIYFDAFAPSKQPSMWQEDIIAKMYNLLAKDGILVTYCANGQFKRNLKDAGFEVQTLNGPPGKKEMTRAVKK